MKRHQLSLMIILQALFLSACTNNVQKIQKTEITEKIFNQETSYTQDEENVYWHGKVVKKADPETFQEITDPNDQTPENTNDNDFYFFKDKNALYMSSGPFGGNAVLHRYAMENIENLILPEGMLLYFKYVTDAESVYYLSDEGKAEKITEADIHTFEQVDNNYGYMRDKNNVYFHGKILEEADVATFTGVSSVYKDKNHVYYYGKIINNADSETFETIRNKNGGICYYKDKNYVYRVVQPVPEEPTLAIVEGADPQTFECADGLDEYGVSI